MSKSKSTKQKAPPVDDDSAIAVAGSADDATEDAPVQLKWWMHLLGAFVAFHCIGAILMSAPSPEGSLRRSAWKEATAQAEFHAWAEGLRSVGVSITDADFEQLLWDVSREYVGMKSTILTPYRKYTQLSGARQGWRMFVAPHRNPSILHIDVEEKVDGHLKWRNVYGSTDGLLGPDRTTKGQWRSKELDHNRVRKTVFLAGWKFRRQRYRELSFWLAEKAALDFPDATRVRVRMYRYRTLTPDEVRTGQKEVGKWHSVKTFDLAKVRERLKKRAIIIAGVEDEDPELRRKEEAASESRREDRAKRKKRKETQRRKRRAAQAKRQKEKAAEAAKARISVEPSTLRVKSTPAPVVVPKKPAVPPMPQVREGAK